MLNCIPENVMNTLKSFAIKARDILGDVEIYLFGSYARCDWVEDSDIDLLVISDAFKNLDLGKRYALVRKMLPSNMGFEILTYTREEFEIARRKSIVLQDAAEYWVRIA